MRSVIVLAFAVLAGCGGSNGQTPTATPPPDTRPPNVRVTSGAVASHDIGKERVSLALENAGGPGSYKVEFWGFPFSPNGNDSFYGSSEVVDVLAAYRETVTWIVTTGSPLGGNPRVGWVVVLSRAPNTAVWTQTSRHEFP
jgi:hypothetical protein